MKDIFEAFETVVKAPSVKDTAYRVVRSLAVSIFNDRNDPETAYRLIDGLKTYRYAKPSHDLKNQLDKIHRRLYNAWKLSELKKDPDIMSKHTD